MKKGLTVVPFLVGIAIVLILGAVIFGSSSKAHACGGWFDAACGSTVTEQKSLEQNQNALIQATPIPQLTNSLERENIAKRAELFNKPDKISYIYLVSFGKVMAFYTVKGKVSSLNSYMVPQQKIVARDYGTCYGSGSDCFVIDAPDIDGSYGQNAGGIFFFTTDGTYVEWKGDYMMADQPLQLTTVPELVRTVK